MQASPTKKEREKDRSFALIYATWWEQNLLLYEEKKSV